MSKKDYIAIAETIKNAVENIHSKGIHDLTAIHQIAYDLASMFKADNPRFKKDTFLNACNVPIK